MLPLVSILIPAYNAERWIGDTLKSVVDQTWPNKEIIVVDDGSTDGSQEILRQYGEAFRLICLETNQGACAARNRGAALAKGTYLVFLDGDDVLLPRTLEVFEGIAKAKQPELILGNVWWFKGQLPALRPEDIPYEISLVEWEDSCGRTALCKPAQACWSLTGSLLTRREDGQARSGPWRTTISHSVWGIAVGPCKSFPLPRSFTVFTPGAPGNN